MAISTEKLLTLAQFQTGLQASKKYTDDQVKNKADKATTLAGYGITDAYTKTELDGKLSSAMHYKGSVANFAALPTEGQEVGDMYNVAAADTTHGIKAGDNVAWNGTDWDVLSGVVDLSNVGLKLTDLSAETTGSGNAVTAVSYDNATGKFTIKKDATYLTEGDISINVATDAEVTAACNAVFGAGA